VSQYTHMGKTEHLWGQEKIIINLKYCGKILTIYPNGKASSIHFHKLKTKTFHALRGFIRLQTFQCTNEILSLKEDDWIPMDDFSLSEGISITIQPKIAHRFWAWGEVATLIEFSFKDDPNDLYKIIPAGEIPLNKSYS